ncbi:hypothetical protein EOD23_06195 [Mesorhizobium sp. USDA-HM6]|nr:hypothetical protein EOD23_06195 [Mesorhizobium sp. USDA-HM6]
MSVSPTAPVSSDAKGPQESSPSDVGAAPHPPAGTFSPCSDGEKGLAAASAPFNAGDWRNQ